MILLQKLVRALQPVLISFLSVTQGWVLETNILLQKLVREFLQPVLVSQMFFQVGSPVPRLALSSPSSYRLHLSCAEITGM